MQINLHNKNIVCQKKWNSNHRKLDLKAPSTSTWGPNLKISVFSSWEEYKKSTRVESDERKGAVRKEKLVIARSNAPVLLQRSKIGSTKRQWSD